MLWKMILKAKKLDEGIVLTKDSYEYLSRQSIFSKGGSEFKEAFGKMQKNQSIKQKRVLDYDKSKQMLKIRIFLNLYL